MSDLVAFLLARISEDESVARKCDEWDQRFRDSDVGVKHVWARLTDDGGHSFWEGCPTPSRVLAECAAKWAIIEWHKSWPVLLHEPPVFESSEDDVHALTMRVTQRIAWATEQEYRARFGTEPPTGPILLALAQPFADHPDFDPAWRTS